MLPILKTKSTLIKSLEYLPDWYREESALPSSHAPNGKEFKVFGRGDLPVITCCRPLFYYLAPHMLMFTSNVKPMLFLLLTQAPTVLYTQSLALDLPSIPRNSLTNNFWGSANSEYGTVEKRDKDRMLVLQVLDQLPKLIFLQLLSFSHLDQDDLRLYALEQTAKLSRLQTLHWPGVGYGSDELDQFPLIENDSANPRFNELKESVLKTAATRFAASPFSTSSSQQQQQLQIPVATSVVYLHAIPLVKLYFATCKAGCELEVALFATSWTLRSLTLNRSGSVVFDGNTIKTIATACPRLAELSVAGLAVENEDSLRPFSELVHLEILTLHTALGLSKEPAERYYYSQDSAFVSLRRALNTRSEREFESARRGFRHFQNCAGSLREVAFGFDGFGSDTPILSFFGYDDAESGGTTSPCVYPHLEQMDWGSLNELSEKALSCFNSHVVPNLKKINSGIVYGSVAPCEGFTEHVLRNVVGALQNLNALTTPALRSKNLFASEENELGVAMINAFISTTSTSNKNEEIQLQQDSLEFGGIGFPSSLSTLSIQQIFVPASSNDHRGGFTQKSIENYIQQQNQLFSSSSGGQQIIRHQFCGRNLKILTVSCEISDAFLKILGESTELQKSIEHLTLGSRAQQRDSGITDDGIYHLRHFGKTLKAFQIYYFKSITSEGVVKLIRPHLSLLQDISLMHCDVDDIVLEGLQDNLYLSCVDVEGSKITGSGFKYFSKLTNLCVVMMQECKNVVDVEVLAPLDEILVPGAYVDVYDTGLFVEDSESEDNVKMMHKILLKVLNKSWRQGLYINGNGN